MVKETAFQFALTEMRTMLTSPRAWGVMGVVVLILGISGPFQTYEYLAIGPRLAYWGVMCIVTFGAGNFFGTWASKAGENLGYKPSLKFLFSGLSSGIAVAFFVNVINLLAIGDILSDPKNMLIITGYCVGISMGIVGLFNLFAHSSPHQVAKNTPRILSRLPIEKRGELISMSVQDHYVEIVTSKGKHLTLVRLGDAINETEGTDGFQIHRSHWVAHNAIKSVSRQNGKAIVTTKNDGELPVSRTYIRSLKEAGLLV